MFLFFRSLTLKYFSTTLDLDDEDYDLSETSIQSWIIKLPKAKFNLVCSASIYFAFAVRYFEQSM